MCCFPISVALLEAANYLAGFTYRHQHFVGVFSCWWTQGGGELRANAPPKRRLKWRNASRFAMNIQTRKGRKQNFCVFPLYWVFFYLVEHGRVSRSERCSVELCLMAAQFASRRCRPAGGDLLSCVLLGISRQIVRNVSNFTPSSARILWNLVHVVILCSEDDCRIFRLFRTKLLSCRAKHFFRCHVVGASLAGSNS